MIKWNNRAVYMVVFLDLDMSFCFGKMLILYVEVRAFPLNSLHSVFMTHQEHLPILTLVHMHLLW